MSMINLLNGIVKNNQEIIYVNNKESALQRLILHKFTPGEVFIIGYYTEGSTESDVNTDIIVAIGVEDGMGPEKYRIIADRRVMVVTSVLPEIPDVSSIIMNQRYIARDQNDGKLYYLWRLFDEESGLTISEKKEVVDKCTIIDSSTNNMYVCNPPELINFYEAIVKPGISKIVSDGENISLEIESEGKTYTDLHFINSEEKNYLISKVFESNFKAEIEFQKYDKNGNPINSVDPCEVYKTIFTLTPKYSGENVELDNIPEGWTFDDRSKIYTKEFIGNSTVSSGSPICTYTVNEYTGSITVEQVTSEVYKYFFILYSDDSIPTVDKIIRSGIANLVSSPKGIYIIQPRSDLYTWFCFPKGMEPSSITQLGLNYKSQTQYELNDVFWKKVNLGTYTLYRSLNTGNGYEQTIVIQ